jgi:hypothetical protein
MATLNKGMSKNTKHKLQVGMAPQVVRNDKAKQKYQEREWTKKKEEKEHEKTTMQMRL